MSWPVTGVLPQRELANRIAKLQRFAQLSSRPETKARFLTEAADLSRELSLLDDPLVGFAPVPNARRELREWLVLK